MSVDDLKGRELDALVGRGARQRQDTHRQQVFLTGCTGSSDELAATRWEVNSTDKLQIEPKDDLRSRIGRSPDRADAVALVFADYAPRAVTARGAVRW